MNIRSHKRAIYARRTFTSIVKAAMVAPVVEAVKLYTVARKKDNEVVARDVSLDAANELIAKAKAAKKASLFVVELAAA